MKNVGAILMDEHPGLVGPVIGVAADVVSPLQDPYVLALFRQRSGRHGPGVAGAHHQNIKLFVHGYSILSKAPSAGACVRSSGSVYHISP